MYRATLKNITTFLKQQQLTKKNLFKSQELRIKIEQKKIKIENYEMRAFIFIYLHSKSTTVILTD